AGPVGGYALGLGEASAGSRPVVGARVPARACEGRDGRGRDDDLPDHEGALVHDAEVAAPVHGYSGGAVETGGRSGPVAGACRRDRAGEGHDGRGRDDDLADRGTVADIQAAGAVADYV